MTVASAALMYSGDASAEAADSAEAAGPAESADTCSRYAARVRFKRHSPTEGYLSRLVVSIRHDLEQSGDPVRNLEGRLAKMHPVLEDHVEYPGLIDGMIEKISDLGADGKAVHVEIYGFASTRKKAPAEKIALDISTTRAQFLELTLGMGRKVHNERNPGKAIFIPYIPLWPVGETAFFGAEDENDTGIVLIRHATTKEAGFQADQIRKLRAKQAIDPSDYAYEVTDFSHDPDLVAALRKLRPMSVVCVGEPEKTHVEKGGFNRISPYGDAGAKAEPIGRLVSSGATSAVRTESSGAEPLASGRARPPKTQPAQPSQPWAETKTIQEYDSRISHLAAKQSQLRRATYIIFGMRVAEEIHGLRPECSDFADNDRDGTADHDGVVYKGPPMIRMYARDSGCSSPQDRTEGEHICEGVIYALDYIQTFAEQPPAEDVSTISEACQAYNFLAESNRTDQCVDRYALLAKHVRQLAKDSIRLRDEIDAYCEQHDCEHHVPAVFMERHLGDLLDSGRELYKGIKLREVHELNKKQGPDWQSLCEGMSST